MLSKVWLFKRTSFLIKTVPDILPHTDFPLQPRQHLLHSPAGKHWVHRDGCLHHLGQGQHCAGGEDGEHHEGGQEAPELLAGWWVFIKELQAWVEASADVSFGQSRQIKLADCSTYRKHLYHPCQAERQPGLSQAGGHWGVKHVKGEVVNVIHSHLHWAALIHQHGEGLHLLQAKTCLLTEIQEIDYSGWLAGN